MKGITELTRLLAKMNPVLSEKEYIFHSVSEGKYGDLPQLKPICAFQEDEGLSLSMGKSLALEHEIKFEGVYKQISLQVNSALEALEVIGLTKEVSKALSESGISFNVVAAFYHDHTFVPSDESQKALNILQSLSRKRSIKTQNPCVKERPVITHLELNSWTFCTSRDNSNQSKSYCG